MRACARHDPCACLRCSNPCASQRMWSSSASANAQCQSLALPAAQIKTVRRQGCWRRKRCANQCASASAQYLPLALPAAQMQTMRIRTALPMCAGTAPAPYAIVRMRYNRLCAHTPMRIQRNGLCAIYEPCASASAKVNDAHVRARSASRAIHLCAQLRCHRTRQCRFSAPL